MKKFQEYYFKKFETFTKTNKTHPQASISISI